MVKTLRESKAKLSELVERASQGEDILITVRGRVKARLTKAEAISPEVDRAARARELSAFRDSLQANSKRHLPIEKILEEDRR